MEGKKSNNFGILIQKQLIQKKKKKDLCRVWRWCCDWANVSKVVCRCQKSRAGDFSLYDAPQSGRPVEVDSNQIKTASNQHYTTREIVNILKISKSSVENHLHQHGYVNHFDIWVRLKLSQKNIFDHISTCNSLLKHNESVPFLKQIVTGNEKWILFNNMEWKRSWDKRNEPPSATPKASLHSKKVMLCVWWDWMGVLYYELLPENQSIPRSTAPS